MPLGTTRPNLTRPKPRPRPGGGSRPPVDRPRGGGGGGGGHGGDGLPNYGERLRRYRLGLAIALVSIVVLFLCMGAAFIFRQGLDVYDPSTGVYVREWHPLHLPMRLLWLNTFVLIASSITLELARRQAIWQAALAPALRIPGIADDRRAFPWLPASVLLAFAFLAGQSFAWTSVFRSAAEYRNANPSFFYMLTGTHAVHITAGMIALIYALGLAWRRRGNDDQRRIVIDVTAWYWHVMCILWIYLFTLLLLAA